MVSFSWISIAIICVSNALIDDFQLTQNYFAPSNYSKFVSSFAAIDTTVNKLFLVGGNDGDGLNTLRYEFDLSSLTQSTYVEYLDESTYWQQCPDIIATCDSEGLLVGHAWTSSNIYINNIYLSYPGSLSNTLFIYDVLEGNWRDSSWYNHEAPEILTGRCMATSKTNKLYIFGVSDANFTNNSRTTLMYDYDTDIWNIGADMLIPAWKPGCAIDSDGTNMYILGGRTSYDNYRAYGYGNQIQQYSLLYDQWSLLDSPTLITPRVATRCVSNPFENEIVCIGGEGYTGRLGTAEVFDITNGYIYQVSMATNPGSIAETVWVHESNTFGYIFVISSEGIQFTKIEGILTSEGIARCSDTDSYCSITCDGTIDCSYINGISAYTLEVDCNYGGCKDSIFDCGYGECIINCQDCVGIRINAQPDSTVQISCSGDSVCIDMEINANSANNLQLYCTGWQSCSSFIINAFAVDSLTMDIKNADAYSNGLLNATDAAYVSIMCSSSSDWQSVCHGSEWYLPNYGYNTFISCYGYACSGFGTIHVQDSVSALGVYIKSCDACYDIGDCVNQWDITCNYDTVSWYGTDSCGYQCDCAELSVSFHDESSDSLCYSDDDVVYISGIQSDSGFAGGMIILVFVGICCLCVICGIVWCCFTCQNSGSRSRHQAPASGLQQAPVVKTRQPMVVRPQPSPQPVMMMQPRQQPVMMMQPQQQQQQVMLVQVMPSGGQAQGAQPQYVYVKAGAQMQGQPIQNQQTLTMQQPITTQQSLSAQQPAQISQPQSFSTNAPPVWTPSAASAPSSPSAAPAPFNPSAAAYPSLASAPSAPPAAYASAPSAPSAPNEMSEGAVTNI